jgi:hypothetical protein
MIAQTVDPLGVAVVLALIALYLILFAELFR